MDLQRIDLKAALDAPRNAPLDSLLAIFGRWRNDKEHPARWVDLADYAHMSRGAGILIVGKQGIFGVTRFDPGLAVYYSGRDDYEGSVEQRITESFRRHLALTAALFAAPEYPAEMKALTGAWELTLNDRLHFPNNEATDALVGREIRAALDSVLGPGAYETTLESDSQKRYGFTIQTNVKNLEQLRSSAEKALA